MRTSGVDERLDALGYWKERAFIAEQSLERERRILLDDFATAALTAMIAKSVSGKLEAQYDYCAIHAYDYADAMLVEKKRREAL